jgi:hypothetical protein
VLGRKPDVKNDRVSIGSSKPTICVAVISVSASNSKPLRLATRTRYDRSFHNGCHTGCGFGLAGKQEQLEQLTDKANSGHVYQLADLLEAGLPSPRATTAATGSPEGGPRTFRLLPETWSAMPSLGKSVVAR